MGWKTIRSFNLNSALTINDKEIPDYATYSLRESPKGQQYWSAAFRRDGKVNSVHIGKELPFEEPLLKSSEEELLLTVSKLQEANITLSSDVKLLQSENKVLLLTVSKLQKENMSLKEKIRELESNRASVNSIKQLEIYTGFEVLHLDTVEGEDNMKRMDAASLIVQTDDEYIRLKVYADQSHAITYGNNKKQLSKSIGLKDARKIAKKWDISKVGCTFLKRPAEKETDSYYTMDITPQECANLIFANVSKILNLVQRMSEPNEKNRIRI